MLFNNTIRKKSSGKWQSVLLLLLVSSLISFGQDAPEKKKPVVNLSYFKINTDSFFVKASAKYKVEKAFFPLENHSVSLYLSEADEANFLGKATTNYNGEAKIFLPKKIKENIDTLSSFDLVAETEGDADFKSGSGSVTIENVFLELQIEEIDSTKMLRAVAYKKEKKGNSPLADIELNFYAGRAFGLLPLSGDNIVTDENGMAEMEYINDLPGDSSGTLDLAVKLSDADTYGNVIAMKKTYWGKKVFVNHAEAKRAALWASRANVPLWLLILSNGIIIGVWGTIVFLVFQVFKIRKLGREN